MYNWLYRQNSVSLQLTNFLNSFLIHNPLHTIKFFLNVILICAYLAYLIKKRDSVFPIIFSTFFFARYCTIIFLLISLSTNGITTMDAAAADPRNQRDHASSCGSTIPWQPQEQPEQRRAETEVSRRGITRVLQRSALVQVSRWHRPQVRSRLWRERPGDRASI